MSTGNILDLIPLWLFCLALILVLLASVECGFRLGSRAQRADGQQQTPQIGTLVGALLALLGFLLAFTFGMAGSRFDARKQLLLDEANSIGTAHLRAGLLPEPHRAEVRRLRREYLDVRLAVRTLDDVPAAVAKSDDLHRRLWAEAEACTQKNPNPVTAMFVQSLNELIDLHTKRLTTGLEYRIPASILVMLGAVSILSMGVLGYHFGLAGSRNFTPTLILVLVFSAVLILIIDLDRPQQGMFSISKQALLDLRTRLNALSK
jgi:hypothetical protein